MGPQLAVRLSPIDSGAIIMRRSMYVAVIITLPFAAWSDEGMWTVDNFPSSQVSEKYNVDVDEDWLRSAQLSTTRLENGCTGSRT